MRADASHDSARWRQYRERIQRVMDYIREHPTGDLSNDALAEVACLSSFHWHRIYRAITGESASTTVRRTRMHRAATILLRSDRPVAEIGAECGYPDVHSFTRTFKAYAGMAPGRFREHHRLPSTPPAEPPASSEAWPVRFEHRAPVELRGLWHRGNYIEIGACFEKVFVTAMAEGWMQADCQVAGVYFQDPAACEPMSLRSFAGISIPAGNDVDTRLERWQIPGGRFAIARHQGPYAHLDKAYRWLYTDWLRNADVGVRDQPCAEVYLNHPRDTPFDALLTDILLPLEED